MFCCVVVLLLVVGAFASETLPLPCFTLLLSEPQTTIAGETFLFVVTAVEVASGSCVTVVVCGAFVANWLPS